MESISNVVHDISGVLRVIGQPPPGTWMKSHIRRNATFRARPPLTNAVSLGRLLAGMLAGRAGFGRAAAPGSRDPWSETVDELLMAAFMQPLPKRHSNSKRVRKSDLAFMDSNYDIDDMELSTGDVSAEPPFRAEDEEEWPDGAISVVHFTVGHEPEE